MLMTRWGWIQCLSWSLNITLYLVVTRADNFLLFRLFHHPAAIFVNYFILSIFHPSFLCTILVIVTPTYMFLWICEGYTIAIWNYMNVYYQCDGDWDKVCVPSLKSGSIYGSSLSNKCCNLSMIFPFMVSLVWT